MSTLRQKIEAGTFVITAEVAPPKGVDVTTALATVRSLVGIDAVNVTDNQGANMRMSSLALASLLPREGIEPILQLTCRDRNRMALQSDLLGAAALGVTNLLLISGDHPGFGDHPQARAVFDLDSVQLLQTVGRLNSGEDLSGAKLTGVPQFFAGAAMTPEAEPFELIFQKYRKKVEAGAHFFQTQAVYDLARMEHFMAAARPLGRPVLLGVLLLRSAGMARFLNAHIPGVRVSAALIERLAAAKNPLDEGIAIAREQVAYAREHCQGVHLMTLGHEDRIPAILR
ncbi:MAG: methylenetetrahydrofolate reductase [Desulfuromonadaceae bacterium]|nr:methylenetetrahydrofolate reductase [Desulfuromonadaceae bacterium]